MNSEETKQPFDEAAWHERIHKNDACIVSSRTNDGRHTYYWLANDGKGNPIPFSLLSPHQQVLFEVRVKWGHECPDRECVVRGVNWFFICPLCRANSFFTVRGKICESCQVAFDENMQSNLQPKVAVGQARTVVVPRGQLEELQTELKSQLALVESWMEPPGLFTEIPVEFAGGTSVNDWSGLNPSLY